MKMKIAQIVIVFVLQATSTLILLPFNVPRLNAAAEWMDGLFPWLLSESKV